MPLLIAALVGALVQAAGSFLGRMLIAAGVGVVSYTGMQIMSQKILQAMWGQINGMPATVLGVMGVLHLGACINVIVSACLARAALNGLNSGTVKKWVTK